MMEIRSYRREDGVACHELRRSAFLETFTEFLPSNSVKAGAESYGAPEFAQRIGAMTTIVAAVDGCIVGFCSIDVTSADRAELLYLYVNSAHRGLGFGPRLVRYAEDQVLKLHPDLKAIYLDTAVPEYNQSFWEHMGYQPFGRSDCQYPTGKIPAMRMEKGLTRNRRS